MNISPLASSVPSVASQVLYRLADTLRHEDVSAMTAGEVKALFVKYAESYTTSMANVDASGLDLRLLL